MLLLFISIITILIFCFIGLLKNSTKEKYHPNEIKTDFTTETENHIKDDIIIKNVEFGRLENNYRNNQELKIKYESSPLEDIHYSIKIDFQNKFDKTIKYITFHVVPFDRVLEPLTCTNLYGSSQVAKLKYTGPIYENEIVENAIWKSVVDGKTLYDFFIKKIDIVFLDESKKSIYVSKFSEQI